LKDISTFEGYCICDLSDPTKIIHQYNRPSMELLAHRDLNNAVVHTHPKYLLSILCSENSKEILETIYSEYEFDFIEYVTPGFELHKKIEKCLPLEENSEVMVLLGKRTLEKKGRLIR
jgi:rhamnose utilization protein RhaD (predicted bifunctional aldolase and dehydrogenase)